MIVAPAAVGAVTGVATTAAGAGAAVVTGEATGMAAGAGGGGAGAEMACTGMAGAGVFLGAGPVPGAGVRIVPNGPESRLGTFCGVNTVPATPSLLINIMIILNKTLK